MAKENTRQNKKGKSTSKNEKKMNDVKREDFTFGRQSYRLLILGLIMIALGFILMSGGGSDDPKVFNEEIFNFRRITLAPILILAGYVVEIFAIMKRPSSKKQDQE